MSVGVWGVHFNHEFLGRLVSFFHTRRDDMGRKKSLFLFMPRYARDGDYMLVRDRRDEKR